MKKYKVRDFINEFGDGIHGTPTYDTNGEYYFINGTNLEEDGIQVDNALRISKDEYNRISRPLNENTILISINGTLGKISMYENEKIALGKSACYLNVKNEKNKYFLKYVLSTKEFKKYMDLVAHGSTVKNIAPQQIADYEFFAPDETLHNRIADSLKLIDDKILNNNKIIEELSNICKLTYNYWFIQFNYPDKDGKPYKENGGKLVYNNKLKREIPIDWEIETLGDILKKDGRSISPNNVGNYPYTPLDILPSFKVSFGDYKNNNEANSSLLFYKKKSILFGAMRSYFHRVCIAPFDGITRTTTFVLKPEDSSVLGYAYETINMDSTVEFSVANSVGTQQPYAVWDESMDKMLIVKPPKELKQKYSNMINEYIDKIIVLETQNKQLKDFKENMLPLLMNGKVSFK